MDTRYVLCFSEIGGRNETFGVGTASLLLVRADIRVIQTLLLRCENLEVFMGIGLFPPIS